MEKEKEGERRKRRRRRATIKAMEFAEIKTMAALFSKYENI